MSPGTPPTCPPFRAQTRGSKPPALFFDLTSKDGTAFIAIADEEADRSQLREHRDGATRRSRDGGRGSFAGTNPCQPTEVERIVEKCIRVAKQHRGLEPFTVARKVKHWTLQQWQDAHLRHRSTQMRQWQAAEVDDELGAF
ncbi:hypothetical protein [Engelhardtia mirabilis]|uniref:hypothetical protein n=1 Tax=Engelhardtia mirabilis TaxID=2528011 RepID=UPI00118D0657|nr:hypothetical protein Pla86_52530 [Planctomycetes bacterium Pla86]